MHTHGINLADPKDIIAAGAFDLITSILTEQRVACHIHMSTEDFYVSFPLGANLGHDGSLDSVCSQSRIVSTFNEKIMPWEVDEIRDMLAWRLRYSDKIITFNSQPITTQKTAPISDWDYQDSDMQIKWRDGDIGTGGHLFINGLYNSTVTLNDVNADVIFKQPHHQGAAPDNHLRVLRKLGVIIRQHKEDLDRSGLDDMKMFAKEALKLQSDTVNDNIAA